MLAILSVDQVLMKAKSNGSNSITQLISFKNTSLLALAWANIEEAAFDIIWALVNLAVSRAKFASSILDNLEVELVFESSK